MIMLFSILLQEFANLSDVLTWVVVSGGAMILAGAVMSLLLENWSGWHDFPVWVKTIVPIILAGIFSVIASVGLALDVAVFIPEPYATLLLMFINWLTSQIVYTKAKNAGYAAHALPEKGAGLPPA